MPIRILGATVAAFAYAWSFAVFASEKIAEQDPIVAVVDNKEINLSDVKKVQEQITFMSSEDQKFEDIYPMLLDQVIKNTLLQNAVEKKKLADDPEAQVVLEQARIDALTQFFISREIEEASTEEALRTRYQENKDRLIKNEVHARHITVHSEEDANAILSELKDGADFVTLAKERSTTPDAAEGGDLGYFERDNMEPAIADAVFSMEIGNISSEPVKSDFGFHVLKVEDKRRIEPTFEDSKEQLQQEIAGETHMALLEELRSNAEIKRFNLDGSSMTENDEDHHHEDETDHDG